MKVLADILYSPAGTQSLQSDTLSVQPGTEYLPQEILSAPGNALDQWDTEFPQRDIVFLPPGTRFVLSGIVLAAKDIRSALPGIEYQQADIASGPAYIESARAGTVIVLEDILFQPLGILYQAAGILYLPAGTQSLQSDTLSAPRGIEYLPQEILSAPGNALDQWDTAFPQRDIVFLPAGTWFQTLDIEFLPSGIE